MGISLSRNQQQTSSGQGNSLSSSEEYYEDFEIIRPIVVTGFGKIYPDDPGTDAENNFSWRVVEKLSETIDYQGRNIPVIKGKPSQDDKSSPEPVKVCYSYVEDPSFKNWLDSTDALVYLHLGVNGNAGAANWIQLETTGRLGGVDFKPDKYPHNDTPPHLSAEPRHLYPELNLESESEKVLQTSFQVSTLCHNLNTLKSEVTVPTSCSEKPLKLSYKMSDNAGRFLCDFLYYISLDLATKRNSNPSFPRNVLFVHIPETLCLPDDNVMACYDHCIPEKAEALAEVIEFIVRELLAQIDAAKDHAATVEK